MSAAFRPEVEGESIHDSDTEAHIGVQITASVVPGELPSLPTDGRSGSLSNSRRRQIRFLL